MIRVFVQKLENPHTMIPIFFLKIAAKFRLYYSGVFFFPRKAGKKIPQKVLTHSFFEVFVLKLSFPGKLKNTRPSIQLLKT